MSTTASPLAPEQFLSRFGLTTFRPGQKEVIAAVLAGHDCLCIMPTGGGKSLCYQLPAIARGGLTLVVSPLIALMKDQVDALAERGLRATFINSSLPSGEQRARLDNMAAGAYHLVYVAPERLRNARFMEAIRGVRVGLLAVDEAHCISEWGHDFRPDYARLGRFRRRLGMPQTIALTATATPGVRSDVVAMLQLRQPKTFMSGFARANLRFEVAEKDNARDKDACLLEFLRANPGAGIIYASTRKKCGEVATLVGQALGRNVGIYHAGLEAEERRQVQEDFMADKRQIIVATNAFGMGIDKPDLRFVVHYNMPGSLEAYYQEAGRAGRDGQPSRCLLLFSYQDRFIQEFFIENAYPSREIVALVYEYLRHQDEDPIEITLEDLKERLELPIGSEGVGACERLLEKCGAIERMDASENRASVRIDGNLPTLVDLLPREAKIQRRVLQAVEQEVGELRGERVYFHPEKIAGLTELDRDAVLRALRELNRLQAFDFVPAFRGRAIHVLSRDRPFELLDIDFDELQERRQAEFEKLERVIRYAKTRRCRQLEILDYFGDPDRRTCGVCDSCTARSTKGAAGPAASRPPATDDAVLTAVKMVLSGVARTRGHFGKNIIAQMLCGSQSAKMTKFRLEQLSTFGLLKHTTQTEVGSLIDELLTAGLLEQVEIERHRPVVRLTDYGGRVMRGQAGLTAPLALSPALVAKLHSGLPGQTDKGAAKEPAPAPPVGDTARVDAGLVATLRRWRQETALAGGWPVYRVMSNATIEELARRKPRSPDELLDVKGIGPFTADKYGAELLELIANHMQPASRAADRSTAPGTPQPEAGGRSAAGAGASEPPVPNADAATVPTWYDDREAEPADWDERGTGFPAAEAGGATSASAAARAGFGEAGGPSRPELETDAARELERRKTKPNFYWTWRLLADGYGLADCQQIRGLRIERLLDHGQQALDHGLPIRAAWFFSAEQLATLQRVVGTTPPDRVRPLLEQLPPDLRYEHVQLYLRCRAS